VSNQAEAIVSQSAQEADRRFVSLANVSESTKMTNQNNSSNVLKTEPQLQPRPQIQQIQHQQIPQQAQIITVQDEKGNQTQQVVYQVGIFEGTFLNIFSSIEK